jgi:iron complex outermembrane receptor protein
MFATFVAVTLHLPIVHLPVGGCLPEGPTESDWSSYTRGGDTLRVAVTDSAGQPLEGANVAIADLARSRSTGSDGIAFFIGLANGHYVVVIRRLGYAPALRQVSVPGSGELRVVLAVSALRLDPITVTATRAPLDPMDSPLPVENLSGEKLQQSEEVSLAHTLNGRAGVLTLSTGQQVGKPVIRGLSGPRVLVLDNGLRLEDYSWSDEDGPSVDPLLAERVEVVRGPASVLYGSDAIGGVINVVPEELPDAGHGPGLIHGAAGISTGTNNAEIGGPLRLEGASGAVGWRAVAIGRRASNFHAPAGNDSTPSGELFNTGYHVINGELALGFHSTRSGAVLRYERYGGDFGLLDGPPVQDDDSLGPLRKLSDDRVQASTNWLVGGVRLETKSQWERHSLKEVVDQSRLGSEEPTFELLLNTLSTDLLLHHRGPDWLSGIIGVSGLYQRNESEGQFPLVPGARRTAAALFAFEQATIGRWGLLMGLRGDVHHLDVDEDERLDLAAQARDVSAVTADVGAVFQPISGLAIAANVGRAFRAPTLFELYTNGPHLGEDRYEVGLPNARPELSLNADFNLRWQRGWFTGQIGAYRNQIDNFLYVQPTDSEVVVTLEEGDQESLPLYRFAQTNRAVLLGVEAAVEILVLAPLTVRGRFDAVRGANAATGEPLPLIPPMRGDLELEIQTMRLGPLGRSYVTVGTEWSAKQNRLGPFDTPTDGWVLLDLGVGFEHPIGARGASFRLRVRNAANARYTDFLSRYKLFAYGEGRNVLARLAVEF